MSPRKKRTGRCLFCGDENLSREHTIAKWLRKTLEIQGPVLEHAEIGPPRRWDTLALVLPDVCEGCNNGWLRRTEERARPVLTPMFFGKYAMQLSAEHQAKLSRWAVKTSLLIARKKSRNQPHGWIPRKSLQWLYENPDSEQPPPGSYVWT